MLVVADSSPINILVVIEHVDVLSALFESVVIPAQVRDELQHARAPQAVRQFVACLPAWLTVRSVSIAEHIPLLDPGEEAAINLVREANAEALLIDDRNGREAALERHIAVIGTLGVLERAAARNLVDLRAATERLSQTNFRLDPRLVRAALERDAARRNRGT